ncbi:MAG: lipid A phosphate methyltransferase [Micavibrio aeruginosavorus]|uniref:Lipid A phosphate methyltransferase n=1 Tax=Micavibrio aeruginosavorus TaxID=349221 RepID=A0A2W5PWK8_9BACT|nr:MAG: lipid A phosphate methyltransferase [Micavibrio aeruginosavorus]
MNIHDLMVKQGGFLFKWRSFIPLLLIFPAIIALSHSEMIEDVLGDSVEDALVFVSYLISLCGLAIRWYTVGTVPPGTSGRNTKEQRADSLNTTGMYSIVKNPLYLGNFIVILGVLLSFKVWWFILIGSMAYWIYIERIIATEERYLAQKFGDDYTSWAVKTPFFFPKFSLWQKPDRPFNLKKVLRAEYNGVMVVGSAFLVIEFIADILFEREPFFFWLKDDWFWPFQFVVSSAIFGVLRYLKKRTTILNPSPDIG